MLPGGAGLVREVAEEPAIGRKIGASRKEPAAQPGARLVALVFQVPAADVRPIGRPAPEYRDERRNGGRNAVEPRRRCWCHRLPPEREAYPPNALKRSAMAARWARSASIRALRAARSPR